MTNTTNNAAQPSEDVVERVARAISTFNGYQPDERVIWGDDPGTIPQWKLYDADARAALAAMPAPSEAMVEALRVGERFIDACFSVWSCGEPSHRVETMLDRADEFRAALNALDLATITEAPERKEVER